MLRQALTAGAGAALASTAAASAATAQERRVQPARVKTPAVRAEVRFDKASLDRLRQHDVKKIAEARGVSLERVIGPSPGPAGIWSKTYTETNSGVVRDPRGAVIKRFDTPLTQAEVDILLELAATQPK